ncbi:hypothetical protein SAMN05444920_104389 [Nonomuraea solani]|uniref:Uncharacterized protein n=1 Tax=Nonomuraea solani TaxID=1144553 RepID=A0A1H6CUH2_9ACTN|nr:hypothetical protein SAMN05444920_104389 [Nonomuraea solani]
MENFPPLRWTPWRVGKVPLLEVFSVRNGVRHLLGAGAGLAATPLIAAGFLGHAHLAPEWLALGTLAATMAFAGVLAGSRISPLASALPGLVFTGLGAAAQAGMPSLVPVLLPRAYVESYLTLLGTWALPMGCLLLAASLFPSRWRAAVRAEPPSPVREEEEEAPAPPPLPKRIPSRY